jgi:hypothetical protein
VGLVELREAVVAQRLADQVPRFRGSGVLDIRGIMLGQLRRLRTDRDTGLGKQVRQSPAIDIEAFKPMIDPAQRALSGDPEGLPSFVQIAAVDEV